MPHHTGPGVNAALVYTYTASGAESGAEQLLSARNIVGLYRGKFTEGIKVFATLASL